MTYIVSRKAKKQDAVADQKSCLSELYQKSVHIKNSKCGRFKQPRSFSLKKLENFPGRQQN